MNDNPICISITGSRDSATFSVTFNRDLAASVRRTIRIFTKARIRTERVNASTQSITLTSDKRLTASALNCLYSSFFEIYLRQ